MDEMRDGGMDQEQMDPGVEVRVQTGVGKP